MEAAKSAANEEMQENKHTDYIYMVTGDRLPPSRRWADPCTP